MLVRRASALFAGALLLLATGCSQQTRMTAPAVSEPGADIATLGRTHLPNGGFPAPGNLLIADQFKNRVVEVDPTGHIVWSLGLGPKDFTARSIIGVNDAERVGTLTLMVGTGTPPGVIPQSPGGAPDDRVVLVSRDGAIVWQFGQFGVAGSGPDQLSSPVQATYLPDTHVLITDQGNNRIIEVTLAKRIV